jgi:hypothetical protein
MAKTYPRIEGHRRKPDAKRDGSKNYGKPCVFCGKGTVGEKWVQFDWMRGNDETVRVCAEHWDEADDLVVEMMFTNAPSP